MAIKLRKTLVVGVVSLLMGGLIACGGAVPPEPLPSSQEAEPASAQDRKPVQETVSEKVDYDALRSTPEAMAHVTMESQGAQGAKGDAGALGARGADGAPGPASKGVVRDGAAATQVPIASGPSGEGFNSIGGSATVNDKAYDLTFFKQYGVNPFIDTEDDNLSTFAMDVDTGSYTVARRYVHDGNIPDPDSIRVEEFVNFFNQGYARPEQEAFAIHVEGSPSPFGGANHWLMRVGLQGKTVFEEDRKDATLIFTIDVSGSMKRENRLELVKRSLRLLVDQLRDSDKVGIVVYGSTGSVLLEPTSGRDKDEILSAIDMLRPGGSTYVEQGLKLAYGMAVREVERDRITRVIVLSDGVGNVGNTGSDSILKQVEQNVEEGVTLTTVGFGMGNYNDVLMEQLANDGDGAYYYVDTLAEARRIFVEDLTGTIQTIAKDAKVQVQFNPEAVRSYRLLGYENRRVADQDFRNDEVDAGEIGAGHSVTALYEIKLHDGAEGAVATVYLRYEDPDSGKVTELRREFDREDLAHGFEDAPPRFQMAAVVAEYAEVLRESYWAQESSLEDVANEARRVRKLLPQDVDLAEFTDLVARAELIKSRSVDR